MRTLKRHWKSYLCSASVVFLIGLVARVLLIVPLYLSLCFPLESFPDFLLFVIGFFFFFFHHHEQPIFFLLFSLIILLLITYQKKNLIKILSTDFELHNYNYSHRGKNEKSE